MTVDATPSETVPERGSGRHRLDPDGARTGPPAYRPGRFRPQAGLHARDRDRLEGIPAWGSTYAASAWMRHQETMRRRRDTPSSTPPWPRGANGAGTSRRSALAPTGRRRPTDAPNPSTTSASQSQRPQEGAPPPSPTNSPSRSGHVLALGELVGEPEIAAARRSTPRPRPRPHLDPLPRPGSSTATCWNVASQV